MAKRKGKSGDIVAIELDRYVISYGRFINKEFVTLYDYHTKTVETDLERIVSQAIIFTAWIYPAMVKDSAWTFIGNVPLAQYPLEIPDFFSQPQFSRQLEACEIAQTDMKGNVTYRPATQEACIGLERYASWGWEHIERRLRYHYAGEKDIQLYYDRLLLTTITNPTMAEYSFLPQLEAMWIKDYRSVAKFYHEEAQQVLVELCRDIESKQPISLAEFYTITQNTAPLLSRIDPSERDVYKADAISDMKKIAVAYGFPEADGETMVAGPDWDHPLPDPETLAVHIAYDLAIQQAMLSVNKRYFLEDLYQDNRFVDTLVDEAKAILVALCDSISSKKPQDLAAFYACTQLAARQFNALEAAFSEPDSALATVAAQAIAEDFKRIALAYDFVHADIQQMLAGTHWTDLSVLKGKITEVKSMTQEDIIAQAKEVVKHHDFLKAMYNDDYFPNPLVDQGKALLIALCEHIDREKPQDLAALYVLTQAATNQFNDLEGEFAMHDIEFETMAAHTIAEDFQRIALAYGFVDADIEMLIATRYW